MASIDSGASKDRAINQEIPLVPFIDLLFCCVMFLLATAVWNKLGAHQAHQRVPGDRASEDLPIEPDEVRLEVHAGEYRLSLSEGSERVLARDDAGDAELLQALRQSGIRSRIVVATDDGVRYAAVIRAMDLAAAAGFTDMHLQGT